MVDLAQLLAPLALPFTVPALPVNQLQRDSRRISAGDLFVAMAGHQADGRHFVEAAIAAGAAAVLIDGDSDSLCWREQVPLLACGPGLAARALGRRASFADLGQGIASHLGLPPLAEGRSFLTD